MTMSDLPERDADYLRLAAYLEGHCSPAEATRIESELAIDPRMQFAAQLLSLALPTPDRTSELDTDAGWTDLTGRIDAPRWSRAHFRRRLRLLIAGLGIAAAIVVASATYFSLAPVIAGHVNEHYEAPLESRRLVRLPDGSRAALEPGARLTYRSSYFRRPRLLTLDGEARFQARPDAERPFEVHANGVVAVAVGTVFSVRANPWEPTVRVSVEQGTVRAGPETAATPSRLVHAGEALDIQP